MKLLTRALGSWTAAAGLTAAVYPLLLRGRCLTWGAYPEEVVRTMPGDDLQPGSDVVTTRAVTIDAPPSAIWPWLVQMGSGRAGAYTYDRLENLFGLDMHSADEILPQFQDLAEGDLLPVGSGGPVLRVAVLDPERALVLRSEDGGWVWSFGLYPDDGITRLVSRNRISDSGTPLLRPLRRLFTTMVMEPVSLLMERRMLLGIKERAERLALTRPPRLIPLR